MERTSPLTGTLRPARLWARPPSPPSATSTHCLLSTQQLQRCQEIHPPLTSPRSWEPCPPPAAPACGGPCYTPRAPRAWRLGPRPPAAFLSREPTRLLSLVLLRRVANSQLPRKAVPNQPYPKPYAPQDPLWPLPPQPLSTVFRGLRSRP